MPTTGAAATLSIAIVFLFAPLAQLAPQLPQTHSQKRYGQSTDIKGFFEALVGTVWVGEGNIPSIGAYKSERRFFRIDSNRVAIVHTMTTGGTLLSSDSLVVNFSQSFVELTGSDIRGRSLRARLISPPSSSVCVFESANRWRSVYDLTDKSRLVLETQTIVDGKWITYLRTVHSLER
jgi:hypothetical protein